MADSPGAPGARRRKQIAPDVFVARVPIAGRDSLPVDTEGMPPFVLEVVSASSVQRDLTEKTELYRLLGAQEYAIMRLDLAEPRLEGYRRTSVGAWEVWPSDALGRLWSAVLGLGLLLLEETAARQQEAQARIQAEEEVARLRATLERLARDRGEMPLG